jgi:metal-dependent hydrolase (beta-lactamase superfamily II)
LDDQIQKDTEATPESGQTQPDNSGKLKKIRTTILLAFLIFEIITIIFVLARFSVPANQDIMTLETSLEKNGFTDPEDVVLKKYDVLDTITFLTGTEFDGRSDENIYRNRMNFDSGQSMWVILEDNVREKDALLQYSKNILAENDYKQFSEKIKNDEVLNFIYDMGGSEGTFRGNWREIGVNELKLASFLPWKKKIDFVALSLIDEKHCGGLAYILAFNPGITVFCPPLTKGSFSKNIRAIERAHNLIPIMPGYTNLTPRLGAFVSETKSPTDKEPVYELDLVIHLDNGVAILSGAGNPDILTITREVKKATGKTPVMFVGGTNLDVGLETAETNKMIEETRKENPKMLLYPNFNTSMIGHQMLKKVFEDNYKPAPLGYKIRFGKEKPESGK